MKLILIIDDDPDILQLLESQLSPMGFRVVTAETSERGLEIAETGNPDLIILDIHLPGMDGIEALTRLRANASTKLTPVIIITGESQKARVMEAMRVGVDDYLLKPYTKEQLTEKLESALSWNVFHQVHTAEEPALKVERRSGRVIIQFLDSLTAEGTRPAFAALLTDAFREELSKQTCVLDLRTVPAMQPNEVPVLVDFIDMLALPAVHVVAGRNFGLLLDPLLEMGEAVRLYLSFGDFALWHKGPS